MAITDKELSFIVEDLYVDDAVDMLEELPANVVKRVLKNATPATRDVYKRQDWKDKAAVAPLVQWVQQGV